MVRPLPTLSGAALVPRGRRGQSDESAVSALPQDRDGVARDVLDAGPFAARHGGEEAARCIGVLRSPLPPALSVTNGPWPGGSRSPSRSLSSLATGTSPPPAASPSATGLAVRSVKGNGTSTTSPRVMGRLTARQSGSDRLPVTVVVEIRLLVEPIKRTTCRCKARDFATGGIVGGRVRVCV